MTDHDWIDAKTAMDLLGVKPQTLYAYVSRHKIRAMADPQDSRQSLYARHDVEALRRTMRRPRARAEVAVAAIRWGDPVLTTAIAEVRDGTLWLRGQRIEECADHMTLEQVAARLLDVPPMTCPAVEVTAPGASPFSRAMTALTAALDDSPPLDSDDLGPEAGRMIALITAACLGTQAEGPIHSRIAAAWGVDPAGQDMIRRALVLLSDHELNPSTFAVRTCASTGASLPAALIAGLATLSGPRHGGVAGLAARALRAAHDGHVAEFVTQMAGQTPYAYGFGHPLYPAGDPRAAHLLHRLPPDAPMRRAADALSAYLALPPNIDAALAACAGHFGWRADAATSLFSIGRSAGWIAHAAEQARSGAIIRPRARYQSG